ncbi:MAG: Ppx/GppA phosphatase family protein [Pseudomonadales bacterium]
MAELHAVLDLGSNSFHLLIARRRGDAWQTVERIKDKVQLLGGFRDGELSAAAVARGLDSLARFAQRLAPVARERLHMVGTHALREASNRDEFARAAERLIGVPLRIIPGEEEARLIYLGVAHHAPPPAGEVRLVVDIGGGSTECAWGGAAQLHGVSSAKVGCVSLSDAYFGAGALSQEAAFVSARRHAMNVLRDARLAELSARFGAPAALSVVGTSGTIESVQTVLATNGWGADSITAEGLAELADSILSRRWFVESELPGLPPERVDIFPAGVALLSALFDTLGIERMRYVDASLPQGVLFEAQGLPAPGADLRTGTITALQQRWAVDVAQAQRVETTALALFDGVADWWVDTPGDRALLRWAAALHEIGLGVAARHYHRHGAYLIRHSDLPGFTPAERDALTLLVRGHRRAFPGLAFGAFESGRALELMRLLAVLRLAVILERGHAGPVAQVSACSRGNALVVRLPAGWRAAHALSRRELEVEATQLAGVAIELVIEEV